jgi:hypothetical protein
MQTLRGPGVQQAAAKQNILYVCVYLFLPLKKQKKCLMKTMSITGLVLFSLFLGDLCFEPAKYHLVPPGILVFILICSLLYAFAYPIAGIVYTSGKHKIRGGGLPAGITSLSALMNTLKAMSIIGLLWYAASFLIVSFGVNIAFIMAPAHFYMLNLYFLALAIVGTVYSFKEGSTKIKA